MLMMLLLVCYATCSTGQSLNQKKAGPATQKAATEAATQPQQPSTNPHYLKKYAMAARWSDYAIARDVLYDMIVENPTNDSLIYTLAYYYYESQQYAPALLVSQDLLARAPKNTVYLELAAIAAEELGVYERALQHYESLYLVTNNVRTLYQIAFLQYNLKRYNESGANADLILNNPAAATEKVVFNDAQGQQKEYSMKVSILNLKGLIAMEKPDKEAARKSFNDALALAPDFLPAKENLVKAN